MAITHVIDGVTYVEVERKAEVGDLVIDKSGGSNITRGKSYKIYENIGGSIDGHNGMAFIDDIGKERAYWSTNHYRVLEPVQTEASPDIEVDERNASPSVLDLLTSLSRKIVSLEQQLRDTQGNVEKLSHELAEVNHLAVRNENDIADLDARVIEFGDTSKSGAKLLAEAFAALARYEEARR